ncbi:MAG: hypothetical protein WC327_06865 [Candidatus Cloacimonadia bacterium]
MRVKRNPIYHKMTKVYPVFVLLLTVIASSLAGAARDEKIDLPDIIITGESEKLQDTISLDEKLREYWVLDRLSRFSYEPFITPDEVRAYKEPELHKRGAITLSLGSKLSTNLSFLYNDDNPFLTFRGGYSYNSLVSDRNDSRLFVGWYPQLSNYDFRAKVTQYFFNDERVVSSSNKISLFGVELGMETEKLNISKIEMEEVDLSVGIDNFTQELSGDKESQTDVNISLGLRVPLDDLDISIPFESTLIKGDKFATNLGVRKENFYFLDYLGLNLITDFYKVVPAIDFCTGYELNTFSRVWLYNKPGFDSRVRSDFLYDNPDQTLKTDSKIAKTPLNSSLVLENDRFIPVSLGYNVSWSQDYLYYVVGTDGLFSQTNRDVLSQRLNLSLSYSYKSVSFSNTSELISTNKEIPFESSFVNRTDLFWNNDIALVGLEFISLVGRENASLESMEDVYLLNLYADSYVYKDVALHCRFTNLLDQKYRKYEMASTGSSYPEAPFERFRFTAGVRWSF